MDNEEGDTARTPKQASKLSDALHMRKTWPIFITNAAIPYQVPGIWLVVNIVVFSNMLWPGEPYHAQEIGLIYGVMSIIGAFSKLILGRLADKYSRKKVIAANMGWFSSCFFLFGFIPDGLGLVSFYLFLIVSVLRESVTAEGPAINSFIDDAVEEGHRSTFFGILGMFVSLFSMFALIISALVFKTFWREYFWIVGIGGVACAAIIWFKAEEPKRGAQKEELKNLLKLDGFNYHHELTKETFKSTILSRTNLLIMIEGIFTQISISIPTFLMISYLQSPPFNLAPFTLTLFVLLFGIPGMMVGSTVLAKKSDALAKKGIKNRLYLIFFSLIMYNIVAFSAFITPFSHLNTAEGENFLVVMSYPIYWIAAFLEFSVQNVGTLYGNNQRPLLQKINLPEAQAGITAANSFLEILASGIGVIVAGTVLTLFGGNYLLAVLILIMIAIPGVVMWLLCTKWIDKDAAVVSDILKTRAKELTDQK